MYDSKQNQERQQRVRLFLDYAALSRPATGHQIARDWVDAVVGGRLSDDVWANELWERTLADSLDDTPAPKIRGFIKLLRYRQHLTDGRRAAVLAVIDWYVGLWDIVAELTESPQWQDAILAQLKDYVSGARVASFRPYHEQLTVPPERFASWEQAVLTDFRSVLRDPASWREPFWEFRAALGAATPWSSKCERCGGRWYLLLGDTGHPRFEESYCSLCVGVNDSGCGSTLVDLRD